MIRSDRYLNGYVVVYRPDHPKAMVGGNWDGYIYEHILIGEEVKGLPLLEGEVVHHLDENRGNNSPDNLLVLSGPMHAKLHTWLNKNTITPKPDYAERIDRGCIRCKTCNKPIDHTLVYCSNDCYVSDEDPNRSNAPHYEHPTKEALQELVWSKPTTAIALEFGVSDKAIEKLCKKLDVVKPPRGYWAKLAAGLICPLE